MDLVQDPFADIGPKISKQGDDPFADIPKVAKQDDDPFSDIPTKKPITPPYNPLTDPSIPDGAKGSQRLVFARNAGQNGQDMGHGFKEADAEYNGMPTRIREDGGIWWGGHWVNPDDGSLMPDSPEFETLNPSNTDTQKLQEYLHPTFMQKLKGWGQSLMDKNQQDPLWKEKAAAQFITGDYGRAAPRAIYKFGQNIIKGGTGLIRSAMDKVDPVNTSPSDMDPTSTLSQTLSNRELPGIGYEGEGIGGKASDFAADASLMWLEAAATGGAGPVSRIVQPAAYFAGKQGGEAYEQAADIGADIPTRQKFALAHGAIGATGAILPLSKMGEGVIGDLVSKMGAGPTAKFLSQKLGTTITEAELFTVLGNKAQQVINPQTDTFDQSSLPANFANMMALKGVMGAKESTYAPADPVELAKLFGSAAMPDITQGRTDAGDGDIGTMGRQLFTAKNAMAGDKAVGKAILDQTAGIPAETKIELQDYAEKKLANEQASQQGLPEPFKVPALSQEAMAHLPLLEELQKAQAARYSAKNPDSDASDNFLGRIVVDAPQNGAGVPAGPSTTVSGGEKARSFFSANDHETGERFVIAPNDNESAKVMQGGEPVATLKWNPEEEGINGVWTQGHWVDAIGNKYWQGHATTNEIADATGLSYSRDPFANLVQSNVALGAAHRNQQVQQSFANHPDLSAPLDEATGQPMGPFQKGQEFSTLQPETAATFKEMAGRAYDNRVADFFNKIKADTISPEKRGILDKTKDLLVQLGFANPTVHWTNMVPHYLDSVGIGDLVNGKALRDLDMSKDILDRARQGDISPELKEAQDNGLRLMGDNTASLEFGKSFNEAIGRDPLTGSTSGGDEVRSGLIGDMNQRGTWQPSDVMQLAIYRGHIRNGLSPYEAVRETARTFPDYQVSPLEGGSSFVHSKAAKAGLVFSRYGLNMAKAAKNMVGDTIMPEAVDGGITPELATYRQSHALSGVGALAALYASKKLLLDPALQEVSGNPKMETRVGGPFHFVDVIQDAAEGDSLALARIMHLRPELGAILNVGFGRVSPGGKQASNPADRAAFQGAITKGDWSEAAKLAGKMTMDLGSSAAQGALYSYVQGASALSGSSDPASTAAKMFAFGKENRSDAEKVLMAGFNSRRGNLPETYYSEPTASAKLKLSVATKTNNQKMMDGLMDSGDISVKDYMDAQKKVGLSPEEILENMAKKAPLDYAVNAAKIAVGPEKEILDNVVAIRLSKKSKNFSDVMHKQKLRDSQ